MHTFRTTTCDVVIAGAGPVGLFLACELRLAHLRVLVLEKTDDPRSPLKALPFGLRGLSVPTQEAFHRRGLLDAVLATQATAPDTDKARAAGAAHWMQQARRPGGHFAGIPFFLDRVEPSAWRDRLASLADTPLATDMQSIEDVLTARAIELGAQIRRGLGVTSIAQSDDGVTVHAGNEAFHSQWLVGCDGGRSTVRQLAGLAFVGTDPEFTGYSVAVEMAGSHALRVGRNHTATGMYTYAHPGTIAMVDFDGGQAHRGAPLTMAHVQAVLRRVSGVDVTLSALHLATTWTDRAHQATSYRKGRVLIAGDAAHIHSPLGGQGLNLGLGDAMNLGWKLAATVRGDAPAGLLDTYTHERHPVGAQVLDWSRAQVALMRPTQSTRALAAIVADLMETRDGATYFAGRVWGMSLRHGLAGAHPLVGRSVPDFELADGRTVGHLLRDGKGLLLDFKRQASLHALMRGWRGRLDHLAGEAKDTLGLDAVLVRPDGVVAWASEREPDATALVEAVSRWFGAPAEQAA